MLAFILFIPVCVYASSGEADTDNIMDEGKNHIVTLTQAEHGILKLDGESSAAAEYAEGSMVGILVYPEDGYQLEKLTLINQDTKEEYVSSDTCSAYVFEMPDCDLEAVAVFCALDLCEEEDSDTETNSTIEAEEIFVSPYVLYAASLPSTVTIQYGASDYTYVSSFHSDTVNTSVGGSGHTIYTYDASGYDFFCIEPGRALYSGSVLTKNNSSLWNGLSTNEKNAILITLAVGYNGNSSITIARRLAMQALIWELIEGDRSAADYKRNNSEIYTAFFGSGGSSNESVLSAYNSIVSSVQSMGSLNNVSVNADNVIVYGTSSLQDGLAVAGIPTIIEDRFVNLELIKKSGNTSISGNAYSLKGAKYTLYSGTRSTSDGGWSTSERLAYAWNHKKQVLIGTTDEKGTFTFSDIELNTSGSGGNFYFIKETSAPSGYMLDDTIKCIYVRDSGKGDGTVAYSIYLSSDSITWKISVSATVVSSGHTIAITSTEQPLSVNIKLVKKPDSTILTSSVQSLQGAKYTFYRGNRSGSDRDWSTSERLAYAWNHKKQVTIGITDEKGAFTLRDIALNTSGSGGDFYFIKETSAPSGYMLDDTISCIYVRDSGNGDGTISYNIYTSIDGKTWKASVPATVVSSGHVIAITSTEPLQTGWVQLKKKSGNASLTDGNSCYSLEGAVYKVYSDEDCMAEIGELITKADGTTEPLELPAGTYYVKETIASPGYKVCNGSDGAKNAIHVVEVKSEETTVFECVELPLNEPFALNLQKRDADTRKAAAVGTASLEGALFQVDYWDNTDGKTEGSPFRQWVFKTDGKGFLICNKDSYLVLDKSDEVYRDGNGKILYPLGTYTIKEILPPKYYQLKGTMELSASAVKSDVIDGVTVIINEENDNTQILQGNTVISAENLSLNVYDEVYRGTVKVVKYDSDGKTPLSGVCFRLVGDDGIEYTGISNDDGEVLFEELIPQHYVLTEISTVAGHALLKDNIDITIPLQMTEDEVKANNADLLEAVWDEQAGAYCFYNATYEVANSISFQMPASGGESGKLYIPMLVAFALIGIGLLGTIRRKRV